MIMRVRHSGFLLGVAGVFTVSFLYCREDVPYPRRMK